MSTPNEHRVRAHDRLTPDGRRVRVGAHRRTTFSTARARRNFQRALILRRRNKATAWRLAAYAAAEVGAYAAMRGTGVALAALGVLLVEGGLAMRRRTSRQIPAPRSRGWNIPLVSHLQEARRDLRSDTRVGPPRPRSPQQRRRDAAAHQERVRVLARQQREEDEQREALRQQHQREDTQDPQDPPPRRPAPGHPGGRTPVTRAEWKAAPPSRARDQALDFFRIREDEGYTGRLEWDQAKGWRKADPQD